MTANIMQHKERISSFHQWPGLLPEKKHKFQYELLKVNFPSHIKIYNRHFFLVFFVVFLSLDALLGSEKWFSLSSSLLENYR